MIIQLKFNGEHMNFKYCRIQGKELAANTKTGKGIFSMLNQMVTDGVMDEEDVGLFKQIDLWFSRKLPWPPQCKRQEKVICYFKEFRDDDEDDQSPSLASREI